MTARDVWRWTDERGVQRLVGTDELRAALSTSILPSTTLVWREGMKEWAPAQNLPELAVPGPARTPDGQDDDLHGVSRRATLVGLSSGVGEPADPNDETVPPIRIAEVASTRPAFPTAGPITQIPPFGAPAREPRAAFPPAPRVPVPMGSPVQAPGPMGNASKPAVPKLSAPPTLALAKPASPPPAAPAAEKPRTYRKITTSEVDGLWATTTRSDEDETIPRRARPSELAAAAAASATARGVSAPLLASIPQTPPPPSVRLPSPSPSAVPPPPPKVPGAQARSGPKSAPPPPPRRVAPAPPAPPAARTPPPPIPASGRSVPPPVPTSASRSAPPPVPAAVTRSAPPPVPRRAPKSMPPPLPSRAARAAAALAQETGPAPPPPPPVPRAAKAFKTLESARSLESLRDDVSTSDPAADQPELIADESSDTAVTDILDAPTAPHATLRGAGPPLAPPPAPSPVATPAPEPSAPAPSPSPPEAEPPPVVAQAEPARVEAPARGQELTAPLPITDLLQVEQSVLAVEEKPAQVAQVAQVALAALSIETARLPLADAALPPAPPAEEAPASMRSGLVAEQPSAPAEEAEPSSASAPGPRAPADPPSSPRKAEPAKSPSSTHSTNGAASRVHSVQPPPATPSSRPTEPSSRPPESVAPAESPPSDRPSSQPEPTGGFISLRPELPSLPPDLGELKMTGTRRVLNEHVAVPLSSLVGAGALLISMVIAAFFVGRASFLGPAAPPPSALPSLAAVPALAKAALPSPPKPCWMVKQPTMWAPSASKTIPFEAIATKAGTLAVGYASDAHRAIGVDVDLATGDIKSKLDDKASEEIERVVPTPAPEFRVARAGVGPLRSAVEVPASPPFVVGQTDGGVAIASPPDAAATPLWPFDASEGDEVMSAASIHAAGDRGYLLVFRRAGAAWAGFITPDHKASGALVKIAGSGGAIGRPTGAWNGRELAVLFADRPTPEDRYEIRIAHGPLGSPASLPAALATTKVLPLPRGGPGGDAFSPDLVGLPDGRWLLMWTEGAAGSRAVRAQTLTAELTALGDPIALSPPAGNFGQGVIGLAGSYAATIFLSKGASQYELWGAVLQCGS